MLKGFKEFILRGNVMDLAIAVVVGAAFTAVVNALVNEIFNPLLGALFKADSLDNAFTVTIPLMVDDANLRFGVLIGALIQFLLIAAVLYFCVVMPLNKLQARALRNKVEEEEEVAPDIALLAEIRDLLKDASEPSGTNRH